MKEGQPEFLETTELTKSYSSRVVVDRVSLKIHSGEVVGILGPNGAGKTTTFYMIIGLIRPDSGKVLLNGEDIGELPMYQRARKGISYLPQESSIFRKLTVEENIMAILETLDLSYEERKRRLQVLLNELNIAPLAKNKAYSLSGGERRRVEFTRILVRSPSFILLDEPFSGIDPLAIIDIQNIIAQLKDRGLGLIITDHNVRETLGVCDRAYILNEGKILEAGTPEKITASKKAREIYLGDGFGLEKGGDGTDIFKLREAREQKRIATGKCEGRKSYDEAMPEIVREIKRLRQKRNGKPRLTYKKIAEELNRQGFTTMTKKPWTGQIVQNIMRRQSLDKPKNTNQTK
jgi:lipopolysaccharide export system ATP-binding protein